MTAEQELARLEDLAEQLIARIDELRLQVAREQSPDWDTEVTPVSPQRYRR